MLRRSHKKSRAGCLECKRRHVKCDEQRPKCIICTLSERDCSYPPQSTPSLAATAAAAASSTASSPSPPGESSTSTTTTTTTTSGISLPNPNLHHGTQGYKITADSPYAVGDVNVGHMELLVRFNFAEHAPELNADMHEFASRLLFKCAIEAPYLMHQILAVSARRVALLKPERETYYLEHAMHLQTRAISIYNETAAREPIDQTNCSALLLFCSLLGRHLLADLLAKQDADFGAFVTRLLEFLSISGGLKAMSAAAWPLLLESDIKHLVIWALNLSRMAPQGHHCDELRALVAGSPDLDLVSREACVTAINYLQVGFDSLLGMETRNQRFLMVFMWPASVPPEFADLLARHRPEAIVVMGYWALLLHCSRSVWHVGNSGAYLLRSVAHFLGPGWDHWLAWPLSMLAADAV